MVFKALSNSGADSGSTVGLTRKHHNLRQIHSLVKEPTHLCLRLHAHASLAKTRPVRHHQNAKQCHTVLLPFVLSRRKQHRPDATGNVSVVDSGSKLGYFSKTESRHKVRESKMERKENRNQKTQGKVFGSDLIRIVHGRVNKCSRWERSSGQVFGPDLIGIFPWPRQQAQEMGAQKRAKWMEWKDTRQRLAPVHTRSSEHGFAKIAAQKANVWAYRCTATKSHHCQDWTNAT